MSLRMHFFSFRYLGAILAAALCCVELAAVADTNSPSVEQQISEAQNFPEPLMWVGTNAPTQAESDDLLTIVTNFPAVTWRDDLLGYISAHSSSAWTPSVRSSLAILCRECGEYSGALTQWSNAWQTTKVYTNGTGKTVGDAVIAHWSQLLASLGRTNQLKPLFDETAGRQMDRLHLQDLWSASKEGYQTMLDYPELAYRCGAFALINVARAMQLTNASIDSLKDEPSSGPGFSMTQLSGFAQQRGMGLVSVVRLDLEEASGSRVSKRPEGRAPADTSDHTRGNVADFVRFRHIRFLTSSATGS